MAKLTTAEFIEAIKELSVLELNELVKLAKIFGSSPNKSIISAFVPIPRARIKTVIGTFLVLSTRT